MSKTRIVIADDHGVVRAGLRALLQLHPDMDVIGEAADGRAALRTAVELHPDVLLIDISMPELDGIEVTRELKRMVPDIHVLVLTVHEDDKLLQEAIRAGAGGYVIKRALEDELMSAIEAVLRGDLYIHPGVTRALLGNLTPEHHPGEPDLLNLLTPRELQVLNYLIQGYTNLQIAKELVLSVRTVETHRASIMAKLRLRNRAELVHYAMSHGLLANP